MTFVYSCDYHLFGKISPSFKSGFSAKHVATAPPQRYVHNFSVNHQTRSVFLVVISKLTGVLKTRVDVRFCLSPVYPQLVIRQAHNLDAVSKHSDYVTPCLKTPTRIKTNWRWRLAEIFFFLWIPSRFPRWLFWFPRRNSGFFQKKKMWFGKSSSMKFGWCKVSKSLDYSKILSKPKISRIL